MWRRHRVPSLSVLHVFRDPPFALHPTLKPESMPYMQKLDWTAARKYAASGSPVLLLGTALITLLHRWHLVSYRWTLGLFALILTLGTLQAVLASKRNNVH
jgi:hypothetical protein